MASKEMEVLDPAVTVEKIKKTVSRRALNRRNFMSALGVTGAAAGAALVTGRKAGRPRTVSAVGPTQNDVLNFALNLEYLEATFYSFITQGVDLPAAVTVGGGTVYQPPAKVTFPTQQLTDLFNEIYYDELQHVINLRSVLGGAAVARPNLNLQGLGTATVTTAVVITPATAISLSRLFEDVGVTAYAGAAALLSGTNLTYAAQILAVEGFHAGALRLASIQNATPYTAAAYLYFNGVLTSGSATITGVSNTAGLLVGTVVAGTGITTGAKITAINTPSTSFGSGVITISIVATASTTANATTVISTTIPADAFDVQPVDPGTAALSAAGPFANPGTSNPTTYEGFFDTAVAANTTETVLPGMAFARTTSQVLTIVYSNYGAVPIVPAYATKAAGGFYPSGLAGNITTI
jgi:hypothetical protein